VPKAAKIDINTPPASPSIPSITPDEKVPRKTKRKSGMIRKPSCQSPANGI